MGLRVIVAMAVLAVALATARHAPAEEPRHRVALVETDAELGRALVIALTPWNLDVVRAASAPGATLPAAEQRARALADELHADVVVWVSPGGEQSVLWVYDAETKHVSSRVVDAALPYDAPTAAAIALSLKALLRASKVAPVAERIGPPPPPPAPPPSAPRATDEVLRAEATLSGRLFAASTVEPRASLGLAWFLRDRPRLAAALALSVGPGVDLAADGFTGRYTDLTLSPSVRARFDLGARLALEPQLGASLHVTSLDGVAAPDLAPVHASRIDGSIDGAVVLAVRLFSRVDAGVHFGVGYMTRYQRYAIGEGTVLGLSPVIGELGLRMTLGVF